MIFLNFFGEGRSSSTQAVYTYFNSTIYILIQVVKHSFEGWFEQTSAVLARRPAARAELIIRIRAETVDI